MGKGWIKIHRSLFEHPVWAASTPEQKVILITILGLVNHSPKKWIWKGKEYEVQPGETITSLDSLSKLAGKGVSKQNVRTALKNMVALGFLTDSPTNKDRLISVVNWGIYQGKDFEANIQLTDKQHSTNIQSTDNQHSNNTQLTPKEECKNDSKNVKNEKKGKRAYKMPENWKPNENHFKKAQEMNIPKEAVEKLAQEMYFWSHSKNGTYINWDMAFHKWLLNISDRYKKTESEGAF